MTWPTTASTQKETMNTISKTTVAASLYLVLTTGCVAETDDSVEELSTFGSAEGELKNGTVFPSVPLSSLAIGGVNGCTATLITEFAALTALDCVTDGEDATFIAGNGRGTITGEAIHHPLGNGGSGEYNVALIRFPNSIYETPGLNAAGIEPIPVVNGWYGPSNVAYGYGARGSNCQTPADGKLSSRSVSPNVPDIDSFLELTSSSPNEASGCPGDIGGPMLSYQGHTSQGIPIEWRVAAIMVQNNAVFTSTLLHPLLSSSEWIRKNSARPDIDDNPKLSSNCVIFDGTSPTAIGLRSHATTSANLGFWNNRVSAVWVENGYKLEMYDNVNYADHMGDLHGYAGESCNEDGCWHDLTGTSNDDDISSLRCVSILPTSSSDNCIVYDQPGNNSYGFSDHRNLPSTWYSLWNNQANYLWIKKGHTASNYRGYGFTGEVFTYTGNYGAHCNSYGCMHDLTRTRRAGTITSVRCN